MYDNNKDKNINILKYLAQPVKKIEQCILHIGFHKTGSSSIQASLSRNLDDPNFLYINLDSINHSIPIYSLFSEDPEEYHFHKKRKVNRNDVLKYNEKIMQNLIKQLLSCQAENVIISGEDISLLSIRAIEKLKLFLEYFFKKIKVIAYIRSPHGYTVSNFQQLIKGGKYGFDIEKYFPSFNVKIKNFDAIFGKRNVQLLNFDQKNLYRNDIVLDFCYHVGIKFDPEKSNRANESISREVLALLYIYNKYGYGYGRGINVLKENLLLRNRLKTLGKVKFTLSPRLTEQIIKKNSQKMKWLEERIGKPLTEDIKSKKDDVCSEMDMCTVDLSTIIGLIKLIGLENISKDILKNDDDLELIAELVHLLRLHEAKKISS